MVVSRPSSMTMRLSPLLDRGFKTSPGVPTPPATPDAVGIAMSNTNRLNCIR